ncbi:hypothetical protein DWG18_07400 [Lysobacter sp. TY2-98]|uniref:hypothetical protein n=1 Tax=Lysobacter sp. TY2-98 TaxID=2290922 RepID=UPI000E20844B|nr:hypothetical protein [Lysobacter sp. TY2-98]AXK72123.1 hypothetical protein DWG18_07400 [Lysobacter sp. TY2-98]
MLQTAAILFLIAALGGLVMAGIRFAAKRNPPAWLAMLHGLLAASGLTLLVYAVCTGAAPPLATLAVALFLFAAAGGAVMSLVYKWHDRLLPAWLVMAHATLAVLGFLCVLAAAFG